MLLELVGVDKHCEEERRHGDRGEDKFYSDLYQKNFRSKTPLLRHSLSAVCKLERGLAACIKGTKATA